jgi:hypothetical protein
MIQVTREVFGSDYPLSLDIKASELAALRQEAEKLRVDAIMLPEVTGHTTPPVLFRQLNAVPQDLRLNPNRKIEVDNKAEYSL